jgi:tellurite resistance protein TerC
MITAGPLDWAVFGAAVAIALVADLVSTRSGRGTLTLKQAALWSGMWIALSLAFAAWVAFRFGSDAGVSYLTAWLVEKSLSVDNLFVFVLIFSQTGIPPQLQRRALFWGVFGALLMRALLIGLGLFLFERFHWIVYPFAALLLFTAVRMLLEKERGGKLVKGTCTLCNTWIARVVPIAPDAKGEHFLVRKEGSWHATPFLVAIVAIELADLAFAVDSIPAVLAITQEPYLVYTSNVFALIGLRSLYFLLSGVIRKLRFLKTGLAVMLVLVAGKLLLSGVVEIPPLVSLAVIAITFTVSIVASYVFPGKRQS